MEAPPLHTCRVKKLDMTINRLHIFLQGLALLALFYYRLTTLSHIVRNRDETAPLVPNLLVFFSETILTFLWLLHRTYKWRPVTRTAYPGRLPPDEKLPAVDIFVCTADPSREPSLGVMNTVISAMALDYPGDKLSVYLSDDGGSPLTLCAMKEAWKFAVCWVPFRRKYEVRTSCPEAYFSTEIRGGESSEFVVDRKRIEEKYEEFKERLKKNSENMGTSVSHDHPPIVEVISDANGKNNSDQDVAMPNLVYVAREKRPSHPHHFKAGAINTLIRVSAVMSNAPYILLLDCDHYCNDPSSAHQAMCFHLDPRITSKLSFVQFPQRFHNIGQHDIYDGRLNYFKRRWHGADGIGGPVITGCNMYMKREALYATKNARHGFDFNDIRKYFGSSNALVNSIYRSRKSNFLKDGVMLGSIEKELKLVASCTYDSHSQWGKQVGFVYFSVVEDIITSENLHRQGWMSVWVDPPTPCFLGSSPTDLTTSFFQQSRWGLGLMQISLSRYCSLLHGRGRMSILQCLSYAALTFDAIYVLPFLGLAIVPQICLIHGISLYPKASDPYFLVFAFAFLMSQLKHVQEVVFFGDSIMTALLELRVWMMKSASCYLYATLDAFLDKFGYKEALFNLTNKVVDDEREARFKKGIYDFQGSPMFVTPICSLYILNVVAFAIGMSRIIQRREANELFAQAFISFFGIIVNYQVFEGMVLRKDKGRIAPSLSLVSLAIATSTLSFGYLILIV